MRRHCARVKTGRTAGSRPASDRHRASCAVPGKTPRVADQPGESGRADTALSERSALYHVAVSATGCTYLFQAGDNGRLPIGADNEGPRQAIPNAMTNDGICITTTARILRGTPLRSALLCPADLLRPAEFRRPALCRSDLRSMGYIVLRATTPRRAACVSRCRGSRLRLSPLP